MSFPFGSRCDPSCSSILSIVDSERERQWRKLIMIPSESICHPAAADYKGEVTEKNVVETVALSRFPEDAERDSWPARYSH